MKTAFRKRKIFIAQAIRKRLDILLQRTQTPYLVTTPRGTRLYSTDFTKVRRKAESLP